MAKVSIIIPTYNVEMYLEEAMDSIVRQTLKDIEIICINDGSTDGSLAILKRYAEHDDRIIIVDKENGGYGIGMNIGLEKATGEYIGILEPDDFVPLNMYEDLYEIAKKNELDWVKADFYRFKRSDNGDMQLAYNHLSADPNEYNKVINPSEYPDALRYIMNTWSGIYRKAFLDEHNIRHNETPGASFQDNGFYFQTFVYAKRGMIIDKPYYMNRRDNPNSSVHNKAKVYCLDVEYDYIRELISRDPEVWKRFQSMYWYKKYYNCTGTIDRVGEEYKREYVHHFSETFKRARDLGELDQSVFTPYAWSQINFVIADPDGYYYSKVAKHAVSNKESGAEKELEKIKKSKAYKIGMSIAYVPRKINKALKKNKK